LSSVGVNVLEGQVASSLIVYRSRWALRGVGDKIFVPQPNIDRAAKFTAEGKLPNNETDHSSEQIGVQNMEDFRYNSATSYTPIRMTIA
jgi:hypothetical protein